jgi:hypothetical protein
MLVSIDSLSSNRYMHRPEYFSSSTVFASYGVDQHVGRRQSLAQRGVVLTGLTRGR